jgi:signal transduction histidine kinase
VEGLRKMIGRLSIRQSFVFFIGCFLVLDIVLCVGTSTLAVFIKIQNYNRFMGVAIIAYSVLCLILADILFYYVKLKKPIDLIQMSAERIANSNLDFTLQYDSMDEMGKLCSAFEYMRENLQENNRMMWRQIEERKRVNSVFAHDMRTPLTVLKGYLEIYEVQPEEMDVSEIRQNAIVMKKHISRLESYVDALNELQKTEDIRLCPKKIEWECLKDQVKQSVEILCRKSEKKFIFKVEPEYMDNRVLVIDLDIFAQLVDNLISNAVRYAREKVEVILSLEQGQIRLVVKDDGNGFSQAALKNALVPFYSESEYSTNRGLGLYISYLLCQIHHGSLTIANGDKGAIVTVELSVNFQNR